MFSPTFDIIMTVLFALAFVYEVTKENPSTGWIVVVGAGAIINLYGAMYGTT